jgi:hypothetical protein
MIFLETPDNELKCLSTAWLQDFQLGMQMMHTKSISFHSFVL